MKKSATCFITAAPAIGDQLDSLVALLRAQNVDVAVPAFTTAGPAWADVLRETIRRADFVVAILTPGTALANVTYEVGVAHGLGKRVLLVVPPETQGIPFDLTGVLQVRASLLDPAPIAFAVQTLLAAPPSRKRRGEVSAAHLPLGPYADMLLRHLVGLAAQKRPEELESVVETILRRSGASPIATNVERPEQGFDFAVWIDELDAYLGNPLLIEVKQRVSRDAIEKLRSAFARGGSRWALLIYLDDPVDPGVWSGLPPNILRVQLTDLLVQLRTRSLPAILRDMRNRVVHGASAVHG